MKRNIFLLAIASGFAVLATAQPKEKKKGITVPSAVQKAFDAKFSGATATWEKEGAGYEANFKSGGHDMSAVFETNGTMSESEMEIATSELPATVVEYVKTHYKKTAVKEAAKITKASGEVNYEAEVNGKDLLFDATGKFIKEAKD